MGYLTANVAPMLRGTLRSSLTDLLSRSNNLLPTMSELSRMAARAYKAAAAASTIPKSAPAPTPALAPGPPPEPVAVAEQPSAPATAIWPFPLERTSSLGSFPTMMIGNQLAGFSSLPFQLQGAMGQIGAINLANQEASLRLRAIEAARAMERDRLEAISRIMGAGAAPSYQVPQIPLPQVEQGSIWRPIPVSGTPRPTPSAALAAWDSSRLMMPALPMPQPAAAPVAFGVRPGEAVRPPGMQGNVPPPMRAQAAPVRLPPIPGVPAGVERELGQMPGEAAGQAALAARAALNLAGAPAEAGYQLQAAGEQARARQALLELARQIYGSSLSDQASRTRMLLGMV